MTEHRLLEGGGLVLDLATGEAEVGVMTPDDRLEDLDSNGQERARRSRTGSYFFNSSPITESSHLPPTNMAFLSTNTSSIREDVLIIRQHCHHHSWLLETKFNQELFLF